MSQSLLSELSTLSSLELPLSPPYLIECSIIRFWSFGDDVLRNKLFSLESPLPSVDFFLYDQVRRELALSEPILQLWCSKSQGSDVPLVGRSSLPGEEVISDHASFKQHYQQCESTDNLAKCINLYTGGSRFVIRKVPSQVQLNALVVSFEADLAADTPYSRLVPEIITCALDTSDTYQGDLQKKFVIREIERNIEKTVTWSKLEKRQQRQILIGFRNDAAPSLQSVNDVTKSTSRSNSIFRDPSEWVPREIRTACEEILLNKTSSKKSSERKFQEIRNNCNSPWWKELGLVDPSPSCVHIVLLIDFGAPPSEEPLAKRQRTSDDMPSWFTPQEETRLKYIREARWVASRENTLRMVLSGRPVSNCGMVAYAYNPILFSLAEDLQRDVSLAELLPSDHQLIWDNYKHLNAYYDDEKERLRAMLPLLKSIGGGDSTLTEYPSKASHVRIDVAYVVRQGEFPFGIVKFEDEKEHGNGLSQVCKQYMAFVSEAMLQSKYQDFNFPAVGIVIAGNSIEVVVISTPDVCHFTKVFHRTFEFSPQSEAAISALWSLVYVLKQWLPKLRELYVDRADGKLQSPDNPPFYLPHLPDRFKLYFVTRLDCDGYKLCDGGYRSWSDELERYQGLNIFYAQRLDNGNGMDVDRDEELVVVKFTDNYDKDAHNQAMKLKMAPILHRCEPFLQGLKLVVMERIISSKLLDDDLQDGVSLRLLEELERKLARLHAAGFVHGDLRYRNIMFSNDKECHQLIDWDQSGKNGEARYPWLLRESLIGLSLSPHVRPCGLILPEHDIYALEYIKKEVKELMADL